MSRHRARCTTGGQQKSTSEKEGKIGNCDEGEIVK
jgi:hypothetical protein